MVGTKVKERNKFNPMRLKANKHSRKGTYKRIDVRRQKRATRNRISSYMQLRKEGRSSWVQNKEYDWCCQQTAEAEGFGKDSHLNLWIIEIRELRHANSDPCKQP